MARSDGFCGHCWEEFHLDDTGGYNPPCKHGTACRGCCDAGACGWDEAAEDDAPDATTPLSERRDASTEEGR